MRHANRRVLVIGGGRDVGRATVLRFVSEGGDVLAVDASDGDLRRTCELARLAGEPETMAGVVAGEVLDITDEAALGRLADIVRERWGALDVLVTFYNAVRLKSIEQTTVEEWRRDVDENLNGPFVASKLLLPLLRAGQRPSIIHYTSIDGILGNPSIPSYSASKGGVIPLTHVQAAEFAQYHIRVNAIARCATADAVAENDVSRALLQPLIDATPLGRLGTAEENGAVAAFLASDDASFVTGNVIVVDGGRTALTPGTALPRSAGRRSEAAVR